MKILIEEQDAVVEFPDGTPVEIMERAISETFGPRPGPSFGEREAYRIDKGRALIEVGKTFDAAMEGRITDEKAVEFSRRRSARFTAENDERFAAENLGERFVGATTELTPYMLDSATQGIIYGETFAAAATAAALAAGAAGPQAALPEEIVTVPGANILGRQIGQAYGAWMNAARVEGGVLYGDLIEAGVDRGTAVPVAKTAGFLIGAIELMQVGQLVNRFLPAGARYSRKALSRFMVDALTGKGGMKAMKKLGEIGQRLAAQTAITTGFEISEELAQETIGLVAEAGAHAIQAAHEQRGTEGPGLEEAKARLQETFTQSLLGFPLLGLPGSAVSSIRSVQQHSRALAEAQELVGEAQLTDELVSDLEQEFGIGAAVGPITQRGQESLTSVLADLVEEAGKHPTFQAFSEAVSVAIEDKDVQALGFDNHQAMLQSIYERARARTALRVGPPDAGETESDLNEDADDALADLPEEGEPDVSFDFGASLVKETIAQTTPQLSRLQERLTTIEDAKTRAAMARDAKAHLDAIHRYLRHRVRPFAKGVEAEEFARVPRVYRNKNGIALDEMVSSLADQFAEVKAETSSELIEFMESLMQRRKELREIIKSARTQYVRRSEATEIIRRIKDIEAGLKAGRRFGREEVKAVQTELIRLLEASDLEAEDRAKFTKTIKNIQTETQLAKAMPEIIGRIDRLSDAVERRGLKARLARLLETTKPAMVAGKPRGKFTGEIQEMLDALRPIVKMTKGQANEALQQQVDRIGDRIPSPLEAMQRRLLIIQAAGADADVQAMNETIRLLAVAVARGRVANEIVVAGRRQRADRVIEELVRIVTGGAGVTPGVATFGIKSREERAAEAGIRSRVALLLNTGIDSLVGWQDLLDEISLKDKSSRPGESFISKVGDVFEQSLAEKVALRAVNERIRRLAHEAYGIEDNKELLATLVDNHRPVSLGRFTSTAGATDELVLSKDQAIKLWMVMQDPTLDETLRSPNGNAFSQEMLDAVSNFLNEGDKAFARAQLAFYQEYYSGVNEVYRKLHLLNLPHNPHYSPIRREGVVAPQTAGFGDLLEELQNRATLEGGSFKSRVRNVHPIALQSSSAVLQQHVVAMERFKAWGEKIRDLNAVFRDAEVRQAVVEQYGTKVYDRLLGFIEDFTRGGIDRARRVQAVDAFRLAFTRAALGVRPVILIKQLMSFPAFAEMIPADEFVAGLVDFAADPLGKVKILRESDFLKTRGENIDRDIKAAMKTDAFKAFRKGENLLNTMMLNVQIGDQGGIVLGGWPVYRYARKQGQTHEQALETFSRIANRTQQSGDIAEQSEFQRGGSVAKLFSMFQSAPNQYLRREIAALRNFQAGRMPATQFVKVIAIYHVILPMLFQLASDAFRWDPEEQLRAVILGPLNGAFILGDMVDQLIRQVMGLPAFQTDVVPVASLFNEVQRATRTLADAVTGMTIPTEEFLRALQAIGTVAGVALGGIPVRAGFDMVRSAGELAQGEIREGIFGLLGWTEFSLKE